MAFSGLPDVTIGNTLCSPSNVEPLPFVKINDPHRGDDLLGQRQPAGRP